jgi:O-antigen/teichoic acid export membrane protein
VLLGEVWIPMVPALKILAFFGLCRALARCTSPLLKAMGKPNIIFWILLVKLIMIALIIYPLTINYGIVGTAISVTVPMALEQLYLWYLVSRLTGISISDLLIQVIRPVLLAGLMYSLLMLLKTILPLTTIPLFFLYVLAGILIYGAGILVFDKQMIYEMKSLKAMKQQNTGDKQ